MRFRTASVLIGRMTNGTRISIEDIRLDLRIGLVTVRPTGPKTFGHQKLGERRAAPGLGRASATVLGQ